MKWWIQILCCVMFLNCGPKSLNQEFQTQGSGIIGGRDLQNGEEPSSSLVALWDPRTEFLCTGTLIAPHLILTAAHCIPSKWQSLQIIFRPNVLAVLDSSVPTRTHADVRAVTSVLVHELYARASQSGSELDWHDLALVYFSGEIPAGYKSMPLASASEEVAIGTPVHMAGFGVRSIQADELDVDRYTESQLEKGMTSGEFVCDETLTTCYGLEMEGEGQLQIATARIRGFSLSEIRLDETKGQSTCSGDSGGPALLQKDGTFVLIGVTSRGNMLCNSEGVYTSVLEHRDWIDTNAAKAPLWK